MKTFLTWEQYDKLVNELIEKIDLTKYKTICGIPRGGALLALLISYKTNIPVISPDSLYYERWYDDCKDVLIIDDIADSGKTLQQYIEYEHDTATLFKHKNCPITPTYYGQESEDWIVFPYETEKDTLSVVNETNIKQRRQQ